MNLILNALMRSFKPDEAKLRAMLIRLGIVFVVFCIAAIVIALGLGFVVWSSYLYLANFHPPYVAALMSGGGAIILALLILLITLLLTGHFNNKKNASQFTSAASHSQAVPDPEALIKRYPLEAGLIAAVAGFLAGTSSDTPRTLAEIVVLLKDSISE